MYNNINLNNRCIIPDLISEQKHKLHALIRNASLKLNEYINHILLSKEDIFLLVLVPYLELQIPSWF